MEESKVSSAVETTILTQIAGYLEDIADGMFTGTMNEREARQAVRVASVRLNGVIDMRVLAETAGHV